MPTFTDDYGYGSGGVATIRLVATAPSASTADTIVVPINLFLDTNGSLVDSSGNSSKIWVGTAETSGGNAAISHGSGGGTTLRLTRNHSTTQSYTSTRTLTICGSISGVEATGYMEVCGDVTIPRRLYSTPGKVGTPSVTSITDDSAYVYWTAPSLGGASEARYDVNYRRKNSPSNENTVSNVTATHFTLTLGLIGETYQVRVRAKNDYLGNGGGVGDWSEWRDFTTVGRPDAVQSLSGSVVNGTATFTWAAPASNGGSALTGYTWTLREDDENGALLGTGTGASVAASVSGLSPGNIHFRVYASNAYLNSVTSTMDLVVPVAGADNLRTKKFGAWATAKGLRIKKSGTWREAKALRIKKSGTWQ